MPRRRFGVAILIPAPLSHEIDGLRRACADAALGRVPAHVTLVPPVNVREEEVADALAVLRAAAAKSRPFTLTLGPAATFHPDTPVLYLDVGGAIDQLRALRDRVFVPPLERTLTWPFVPHVTLAQDMPPERLDAAVAALADFTAELTVDRVHLLEEQRHLDVGRVWSPVADAPLAPAAVVGRGGLPVELLVSEALDPEGEAFASREWERFDVAEFGEAWGKPMSFAVTARREGHVVGIATGSVAGDATHLSDLLVAETERGTGVGSQLLAAVLSVAADHGCDRVTLQTIAGSPAERFYLDRGWVEEAALPRYRMGRDFVRLRRTI